MCLNYLQVYGNAVLYIKLEDYNNTGNLKADGNCCDGQMSPDGLCKADWCDYNIRICAEDHLNRLAMFVFNYSLRG